MTSASAHVERLRLLLPVRWRLAAGLTCLLVSVLIQMAFPKAIAYFIDHIDTLARSGIPGKVVLLMAGAVLLQAIASTLRFYLLDSSGHLVITRLRRRLFDVLINQPVSFFDKHHVGELTSRMSADVQGLNESLTMGAANVMRSVCVFVVAMAMVLSLSPLLSLVLLLFVPASMYMGKRAGASYRAGGRDIQNALADSSKVAQEHFSHVRLVQAYNQQAGALAKYMVATQRLLDVLLIRTRLLALQRGVSSLLLLAALLATLWLGAHLIGQGQLSVGNLTAFVIYSSMASQSADAISEFWSSWMRSIGATDRIFDLLRTQQPPASPRNHRPLSGRIVFENVVFAYPERSRAPALKGINLAIAPGQTVALVGASGAGKSTIASLILGQYQPDAGRLLFDQLDAASLDVAHLRAHMAVVEQEPSLFSGSIADNIAFALPGRDVPLAEVMTAARLAHAHEFISAFPDGYNTLVGERGVQLSGGQKQRIAIARALLRDPAILILDEATSALDSASEKLVQQALDTLMKGRTTIVIAHRFSTIIKADRIFVMDQGIIAQQGTHAELVQQQEGPYYQLMRHQLFQAEQPLEPAASGL